MFEEYLKYSNIPAGAILDRIRRKRSLSQRKLAESAGLSPQSVNNYIHNRRKMSPQVSENLSNALNLSNKNYFTIAQQNHRNFTENLGKRSASTPDLSKLRPAVFWDTRLDRIDWQGNKRWVIQRVFEYGNDAEMSEIIRYYGKEQTCGILARIQSRWHAATRTANLKKHFEFIAEDITTLVPEILKPTDR